MKKAPISTMSVRVLRPHAQELAAKLDAARRRIARLEEQVESYRVTNEGLRDRVAFLTAQQRREVA